MLPSVDPQMERQVEIIQNLTDSYVKIVTKQCRNLVPKMIMFLLIDDTKNFINTDLFAHFHSTSDHQVGVVLWKKIVLFEAMA